MKALWVLGALLLGAGVVMLVMGEVSKEKQEEEARKAAAELPGPERARAVAERVEPALREALAGKGLEFGAPVFLRVFKEEREMELWVFDKEGKEFRLFRTYRVAGMSGGLGPKLREGDGQAPEGFYHVTPARMNPASNYHLAFDLGFPNGYDRSKGRTGCHLMVHGGRASAGCYAMTDEKVEEIYTLCDAALKGGQGFFRVHCFPFRMTAEKMEEHSGHEWAGFWENLREGHDWFEEKKTPPDATVKEGRYVFR